LGQWRPVLNGDYFVLLLLLQTAIDCELYECCIALNEPLARSGGLPPLS
jgi:hypothetical protein